MPDETLFEPCPFLIDNWYSVVEFAVVSKSSLFCGELVPIPTLPSPLTYNNAPEPDTGITWNPISLELVPAWTVKP